MPEIIIIAALAENNAIGKDGDIPWHIREDFRHFQALTMGSACLMGDVTYNSLPDNARPLPGRENIVLTFDETFRPEGATTFLSWDEAMDCLRDRDKIFLCGGASIYKLGLPHADLLELTRIHASFEGDTFFPDVDFDKWELVKQEDKEGKNIKTGEMMKFSFLTYKRR